MSNKHFSADAPVSSKEEDKFSRWKFAERVGQVIAKREDPSGLVIGLYGVWGDGKTSVLNFIQQSLKSEEKVICIKFNPWRYGTENDLLKGFFFTIAEALDTKLIKKGDYFKDLVKNLAPHAGEAINLGWLGNIISHFIKKVDTEELKKRIEAALEKAQKRVLILIDDVDRLDKAEIQLLFKIVKLIADFKYTAYILAFDKDIVVSALQERYTGANHHAGEAFLEKIIQIPLHLPAVSKEVLKQFCFNEINNALAVAEIKLTDQQFQEFWQNFSAFDEQLCTPRRAKLYGNALLFSLPILKGEVNPVDLMLIEGVRIFYPSLYEAIRNHKNLFTEILYEDIFIRNEPEKEKIKDSINTALNLQQNINKENIIELLKQLFPKLNQVYSNIFYDSSYHLNWNKAQRICSENYFSKYFLYSVPNDEVADSAIPPLLSNLASWQSPFHEDENPLNSLINTDNADNIIKKLRHKAKSISSDIAYPLAIAIAQKSALMSNPEILFSFLTPLVQSAILSNQLIQNVERNKRAELVFRCIDDASSLAFKVELFRWLRREDKERPEKEYFSEECLNQFGIYLGRNIIKKHISHNEDITTRYSGALSHIFNILHMYVNTHCVNDYIRQLIAQDHMAIVRLLTAYAPAAWNEAGEHKADFKKEHYNSLTKKIDVSAFIKSIEDNFSHLLDIPDDYPSRYEHKNLNEGELLIQQFLWLHQHPEKDPSLL
ncbi:MULTISPECIES: KAP family P-loop NTPase fold protein [Snodgrassella]|uniref:KAP family P-loop NTPase fold protein n=1 Tax=Snodgrassella TaxID=1193515 RepID=UPI0008158F29|nr:MULTISPECIES: P-loop NTPase fold protein [Snodgrassella]SCC03205.1 Predicted P-loop ATPase, KAP-like [Snodgrassella sp. R-53583]